MSLNQPPTNSSQNENSMLNRTRSNSPQGKRPYVQATIAGTRPGTIQAAQPNRPASPVVSNLENNQPIPPPRQRLILRRRPRRIFLPPIQGPDLLNPQEQYNLFRQRMERERAERELQRVRELRQQQRICIIISIVVVAITILILVWLLVSAFHENYGGTKNRQ